MLTNNSSYNYMQLKKPVSLMFEQNNGWEKENTYLYTVWVLITFISVANKVYKYFWSPAFFP